MRRVAVAAVVFLMFGFLSAGAAVASTAARPSEPAKAPVKAAVPPAPFVESVAPQGLGVLVTWSPEAAVTGYKAEVLPAPNTSPPSSCTSPVTVTVSASNTATVVGGLCLGVAYVAKVAAINSAGTGSYSGGSNPFAPLTAQPPGAPQVTSVIGRSGSLIVSWSAPLSDGGKPLTGYSVAVTAGGKTVTVGAAASATSATVTGLTNGTAYQVTVTAANSVGSSPQGKATGTPETTYTPRKPQQFTAAPNGSGAVNLSWEPPADNGGSPITSYRITYEEMALNSKRQWVPAPGATPVTVTAAATTTTDQVTGLSPADAFWSFAIAAVNSAGTGPSSSAGQPVAPQTTPTTEAVTLSTTTMSSLASDTNHTLTWPSPAPSQITGLKTGQVIVAAPATAAPQGLLDTVESITKNASGGYVVGIAQAPLSAAFTNLSLSSLANPLASSASVFRPAMPGIRVFPRHRGGVTFSDSITLGVDYGDGPADLSGEVTFTPSVGVNIALTHDFVGVPNGAIVSASASLSVQASLSASLSGSFERKIGEIDGPEEYFQVGPAPVIVRAQIPIFFSASGQITTDVTASITVGAQGTWSSQNPGTLSVANTSTPLTVSGNPLRNLSATGNLTLSEQPQLDLYDAAGPGFEADEELDATLNPFPAAGQDYFKLTPSLHLAAGFEVDFLDWHAALDVPIADITFGSFTIAKPSGPFLTISPGGASVEPGATQQFTATRSSGGSDPVTWSILGGAGDSINSSTGLLTTVKPAGRALFVVATDSTGATGEALVTIGAPFDPPPNVMAASALDGRSATVTWSAPARTGGAPIASYTTVTDPPTKAITVPSTSDALTGLTPGVTYLVSVYATNTSGLRSPPTTISFTPSVTCSITWTGTVSNAWSNPGNWDGNRVPNSDDLVCLNGGTPDLSSAATVYGLTDSTSLTTSANINVTDLLTVSGAISGSGTTTISPGATMTLNQATISGVRLVNDGQGAVTSNAQLDSGATLTNAGTLTLSDGAVLDGDGSVSTQVINDGVMAYPGGSQGANISAPLRNSGRISAAGGTLTLGSAVSQAATGSFTGAGAIVLDGVISPYGSAPVPLSDVTVEGGIGGPGRVTIPAGGSVTFAGNSAGISGVDLINDGTIAVSTQASASIDGGTTLENKGKIELADGAGLGWDGSSGAQLLNDAGATISYAGGTLGAYLGPPFNNAGTVSVGGGVLTVDSGNTSSGADTGSYSAATGSTIDFQSGSRVLGTGFTFTGPGQFDVAGGSVTVPGNVSISNLAVSNNGQVNGPGRVTIPVGGQATLGAQSNLAGGLTLLNDGTLDVQGSGGVTIEDGSTLSNAGSMSLADGSAVGGSGQLLNQAGATLTYPGGTQDASINVPFDNYGTTSANVGVLGGTLYVEDGNTDGASDTGTYRASSSGTIAFYGGTRELGSDFTFNGPGQLEISGGKVAVPGSVSISNLAVNSSGELTGPGQVTVPSGGQLWLGDGGALTGGLTLVNDGAGTIQAGPGSYGVDIESGTTLKNNATLALADGSSLTYTSYAGQLLNEAGARISYAGGTLGSAINVPFDNYGTVSANVGTAGGTLSVNQGGTVGAADTGTYTVSASGTISFNAGDRELGSGVAFTGAGAFDVAGAIFHVPGSVSIPNLTVFEGGQLDGPGTVTIPASGQVALGSDSVLGGGVTLVNAGAATIQAGSYSVSINGGSTLDNTGKMTFADGADLSGAGQLLNQAGATISYLGGTLGSTIGVPFDNYGTVSANVGSAGGTLSVDQGGTVGAADTGTYAASASGTITFGNGDRLLAPAAVLAGPGTISVQGGTVTDRAAASGAALDLTGGTMEITPAVTGKFASLTEGPSATLLFDVSPATPTASPAELVMSGDAALDGTFQLQPSAGFVPANGAVLHLFDYASVTGQFAQVVYPSGSVQYNLNVGSTSLTATAAVTSGGFHWFAHQ